MSPVSLIAILTILCVGVGILVWKKTHHLGPVMFLFFVYYFSLFGAWSIIASKTTGTYAVWWYLESKLVSIELDKNYLLSLLYYFIFFLSASLPFILLRSPVEKTNSPIRVSLLRICLVGWGAALISLFVVKGSLGSAMSLGLSGYSFTRFDENLSLVFVFHQMSNLFALISFSFGLVVWFSGNKPVILEASRRRFVYLVAICLGLLFEIGFNYVLGNKNPLLAALVASALLFDANTGNNRRLRLVLFCSLAIGVIGMVNIVRGIPVKEIPDFLVNATLEDFANSYTAVAESTEKIGAHVSMYAVLQNDVQIVYGASIMPLLYSVVPRYIWPNRPEGIYSYYADSLAAVSGQGYTIHHATGWYLNFGLIGIFIGGGLVGYLVARIICSQTYSLQSSSSVIRCFGSIAPYTVVAIVPSLMRAGIEGYKGCLLEGVVIPTFLMWIISVPTKNN